MSNKTAAFIVAAGVSVFAGANAAIQVHALESIGRSVDRSSSDQKVRMVNMREDGVRYGILTLAGAIAAAAIALAPRGRTY